MNLYELFETMNVFENKKEMEMTVYSAGVRINGSLIMVPWDSDIEDMTVVNGNHQLTVRKVVNYQLTEEVQSAFDISIKDGQLTDWKRVEA